MRERRLIMQRLTLREIRHNWLQFASMIVITLLAVTLFCGFLSNTKTLSQAVTGFYEKHNLADVCVQAYAFSDEEKEYLESVSDGVQYRFYSEGTANGGGTKLYIGGACEDEDTISHPTITEGDSSGALIASTADRFDIGSEVKIAIIYEYGGAETEIVINTTISGFAEFGEVSSDSNTSAIYIEEEVAEPLLVEALAEAFGVSENLIKTMFPDGTVKPFYNQALYRTDDAASLKSEIQSHYDGDEGISGNLIFIYDRSTMELPAMLDAEISQSTKMVYVFPIIFLIVSVFVILTTENRLILDDRTEIGTLKGLGFSAREILTHYASMGSVLCLIGGVLGAVIGPFVIPSVMKFKYEMVYGLTFPALPSFHVWGTILAVIVIAALAAAISIAVCMNVARQSPAESMRPVPPEGRRRKKTAKEEEASSVPAYVTAESLQSVVTLASEKPQSGDAKKKKEKGFSGGNFLSVKMASRNILIKPVRALVTVIGITGCVALCVCAFGIGDTVDRSIDLELGEQFTYDITTSYTNENFVEKALEIDGVEDVETYTIYYMTIRTDTASKDIKVYNMSEGMTMTTLNTDDGNVVMTKSIAKSLGISEGDTVMLTGSGQSAEFTVTEILQTAITQGIFLQTDAFEGLYGTSSAFIRVADGTDADGLIDKINEAAGTTQASSVRGLSEYIDDRISSLSTMEITLMIFAVLLSVVVVYNLSLLNIKERTRDIATMKVLGISSRKIALSLLYEIMILAVIGTVLGLFLGYPVTYLVMSINSVELMNYIYFVKPVSYVYAALISLAAAFLINLIFSRSIPKINMTESLKSVE
ncbi:MAG: FtsX-like permease family protein [Clostridia bacterium]|nr:FtsX-like permease family protein [Clostridia bacterium]